MRFLSRVGSINAVISSIKLMQLRSSSMSSRGSHGLYREFLSLWNRESAIDAGHIDIRPTATDKVADMQGQCLPT
jgi:hypothetical protein